MKDSECTLGATYDYLRSKFYENRTSDPIFSYVAFSQHTDEKFFRPTNYDCFGPDSLIAEGFKSDGILMSTGHRLYHSTEIHYIEKMLNVPYRFDKVFKGQTLGLDGQIHDLDVTFYCRDLEFAKKTQLVPCFQQLVSDMKEDGVLKTVSIRDEFELEWVRISDVTEYAANKLKKNPYYLMRVETN